MTSHTQKWTKRRTSGSFYKEKLIDTGAEKKEERQEASKHKSLLTPERKEKNKTASTTNGCTHQHQNKSVYTLMPPGGYFLWLCIAHTLKNISAYLVTLTKPRNGHNEHKITRNTCKCIPLCPQEDIFCGCVLLTHLKYFGISSYTNTTRNGNWIQRKSSQSGVNP